MSNIIELIENLYTLDQSIRKNPKLTMDLIEKTDNYTTSVLKEIVALEGIITNDKHDEKVAHKFIALVQHSRDIKFAKEVCDYLEKQPPENVPNKIFPYLIDKLLIADGKKQKFGTILSSTKNEDGVVSAAPKPIENEDEVDLLRAKYRLEPIDIYVKKSIEMFKSFSRDVTT